MRRVFLLTAATVAAVFTLGRDAVSANGVVGDGPLLDGDDMMGAQPPAFADVVECGPGNDRVYADGSDLIADDCEKVTLGPFPDPTGWELRPFNPVR